MKLKTGIKLWILLALVPLLITFRVPVMAAPDKDISEHFTVSFDSMGGSDVKEQMVDEGEKVKEPEVPVQDGHNFLGWYTEEGESFDFDTPITENLRLTAKWTEENPADMADSTDMDDPDDAVNFNDEDDYADEGDSANDKTAGESGDAEADKPADKENLDAKEAGADESETVDKSEPSDNKTGNADSKSKNLELAKGGESLRSPASDTLLEIEDIDVSNLTKEGDYYLYDVINDTARTFELGFQSALFTGKALTVNVRLPEYGFAFPNNLPEDLNRQTGISGAKKISDRELQFTIDSSVRGLLQLQLSTETKILNQNDFCDIMDNGYRPSPFEVQVKDSEGMVFVSHEELKYQPKSGKMDENLFWTMSARNAMVVGDARQNPFWFKDIAKPRYPTAFLDETPLVEFLEMRVYSPDAEKIKLKAVESNYPINGIIGYSEFNVDYTQEHINEKGTYWVLKEDAENSYRRFFNTQGLPSQTASLELYARFNWVLRDSIDYLDETGGIEYQAPDIEIDYRLPGDPTVHTITRPGVKFTTYTVKESGYGVVGHDSCKRTSIDPPKSNANVVPGATYNVRVGNAYVSNSVDTKKGIEYRSPVRGDVSVTYLFPYEIRPKTLYLDGFTQKGVIVDYVIITACDESGTTRTIKKDIPLSTIQSNFPSYSLVDNLSSGEYIKQLDLHIADGGLTANSNSIPITEFKLGVAETHADGSPLEDGEMLHFDMKATFHEINNEVKNVSKDYYWLKVVDKKCREMYNDTNSSAGWRRLQEEEEVVLIGNAYFRGWSNGQSRDYLDDPVIQLKMTDSYISNLSEKETAMTFLSGNMTLSKNLSGWKIDYTLYDPTTDSSRNATYEIGQLSEDTQLTAEMLGKGDNEYFTAFRLSYAGRYRIIEDEISGSWLYAPLVSNLTIQWRGNNFDGERLYVKPSNTNNGEVKGYFVLTHSGHCNVANHTNGKGQTTHYNTSALCFTDTEYAFTNEALSTKIISGDTALQGGVIDASFTPKFEMISQQLSPSRLFADVTTRPMHFWVELTDTGLDLEADKLDANFLKKGNVEIVTVDGRRWIHFSLFDYRPYNQQVMNGYFYDKRSYDQTFILPLRVSRAHTLGETHPFGDIYFEYGSSLLDYYDGSERVQFQKLLRENTVPDVHGLMGDGDTTTDRLWKFDGSNLSVNIKKATLTGASLYPGVRDIIAYSRNAEFTHETKEQLLARLEIGSPNSNEPCFDHETVLRLPDKTDGDAITLQLRGPAELNLNTTAGGAVTFSYSVDGTNYSSEVRDLASVRYIKVHVDKINPATGVQLDLPLLATGLSEEESASAAISGYWRARISSPDAEYGQYQELAPATYQCLPRLTLSVIKELIIEGEKQRLAFDEGDFSFSLTPIGNAPMPEGKTILTAKASAATISVNNEQSGGVASFEPITFTDSGNYKYTVKEIEPDNEKKIPNVRYSRESKTIEVIVESDAAGVLKARVSAIPTIVNSKSKESVDYTITYNLNGGEYQGDTSDITEIYPYGTEIRIHAAPSRDGYKFLYWKGSKYQPGDSYTVTGNHEFIAQWEEVKPTPTAPDPETPEPTTTPSPDPKPSEPTTTPSPDPEPSEPKTTPSPDPKPSEPTTTPSPDPEPSEPTTTPSPDPEPSEPTTAPPTSPTPGSSEGVKPSPSSDVTPTPKSGPKAPITGDNSHMVFWTLLTMSALLSTWFILVRKRRKYK